MAPAGAGEPAHARAVAVDRLAAEEGDGGVGDREAGEEARERARALGFEGVAAEEAGFRAELGGEAEAGDEGGVVGADLGAPGAVALLRRRVSMAR